MFSLQSDSTRLCFDVVWGQVFSDLYFLFLIPPDCNLCLHLVMQTAPYVVASHSRANDWNTTPNLSSIQSKKSMGWSWRFVTSNSWHLTGKNQRNHHLISEFPTHDGLINSGLLRVQQASSNQTSLRFPTSEVWWVETSPCFRPDRRI